MSTRETIVQAVTMMIQNTRKPVGQCRVDEFLKTIDVMIKAKEAGVDIANLPTPYLTDEVTVNLTAALSTSTAIDVNGEIKFSFITVGGGYETKSSEGFTIGVEMHFQSLDSPDYKAIALMDVDDIKKLQTVVSA